MIGWLKDAVFYEIYPQSFRDTNADGIGDFNGITEKLDYIKELGCNAIWINPCFDSPFHDAGYDVRDYKKVAPRYGTNEDLYRLFYRAHEKGIHILLDLVPGHTSEEHPWFKESQKVEKNEFSDRYIWTDHCFRGCDGIPYIGGEAERAGTYLLNFFKCQPALNYGFLHPEEPWQKGIDDPDCIATRDAMVDVIRFWLEHGCDGFRVDMAASLVKKDDPDKSGTSHVWKYIFDRVRRDYPEAAFVAEWSNPPQAADAGFDMDFYLNEKGNGYSTLLRDYGNHKDEDHSFFKKNAKGDVTSFVEEFQKYYDKTKGRTYISLLTCNHDTIRAKETLDDEEIKIAYATIFTMPGVPFLYYGDEIGMRYEHLRTKEGGYFRTGSRTPMQWTAGKNLGFSEGCADSLYLPVDPSDDAPTVESQEQDENSLLHMVRRILAFRHEHEDLQADGEYEVLYAEKEKAPFVYRRGKFVIAVNPSLETVVAPVKVQGTEAFRIGKGAQVDKDCLKVAPQSFVIYEL